MSAKPKILVVDDNEDFCQNVSDVLELKGCEVLTAYDGFKSLELVKQNGFDLVLMDVKMPVMDGVETFRKIKQMAPSTPVIMVTAYAVEYLIREALREGAFGSLKKPLDFDKLFELITQATANGMLILIVDDDENLCVNMKDTLVDKGFRVSVAHDGNVAMEKVLEEEFDVMLIDLKLPPLNGLETYLSIRDFRPDLVVIVITGYPRETRKLLKQAIKENAYTCLEKPIKMDELISLLGQIKEENAEGILKKPE